MPQANIEGTSAAKQGVVMSLQDQKAIECREKIRSSFNKANSAFCELSNALLEAYENDYPSLWGYPNFVSYAKAELDMKSSTAYGLLDVARLVRRLSIPQSRVEAIGWSKMAQLTKTLTEKPEDAERLLGMAETMSRDNLKEALKREVSFVDAKEAKPAVMRLSMKFEGDSASLVSEGFALAYGDIGKEDNSLALAHIMGEWLMARGGGAQSATLEDWIEHIEKVYGVKLVRAESSEEIGAILDASAASVSEEEDDAALEELLK